MKWTQDQIVQLSKNIKFDLKDENLKKALLEFRYASIPGAIRDIAYASINSQDIDELDKKYKEEGINAFFEGTDQQQNPDYRDFAILFSTQEISSIYSSAMALTISTNILGKETIDANPLLKEELTEPENAEAFLGIINQQILNKLNCNDLVRSVIYGENQKSKPNIPIVDLKKSDIESFSKGTSRPRVDAEKVLDNAYKELRKVVEKNASEINLSDEALKTIFCYGVLKEIQGVEQQPNFLKYKDSKVDEGKELTWNDALNNFKNYVKETYIPKNCFGMTNEIFETRKAMDKYRQHIAIKAKENHTLMHETPYLDYGSVRQGQETVQIHHIFKQSDFKSLANQFVNFAALSPSQHFTNAHPNNDTNKTDPDYQQFLLWNKFKQKDTPLITENGWAQIGLFNMIDEVYGTTLVKDYKGVEITPYKFVEILKDINPEYSSTVDNEYIRKSITAETLEKLSGKSDIYDSFIRDASHELNKYMTADVIGHLAYRVLDNSHYNEVEIVKQFINDIKQFTSVSEQSIIDSVVNEGIKDVKNKVFEDNSVQDASLFLANQKIYQAEEAIALVHAAFQGYNSNEKEELKEFSEIAAEPIKEAFREANTYKRFNDLVVSKDKEGSLEEILNTRDSRLLDWEYEIKKNYNNELARINGRYTETELSELLDKKLEDRDCDYLNRQTEKLQSYVLDNLKELKKEDADKAIDEFLDNTCQRAEIEIKI